MQTYRLWITFNDGVRPYHNKYEVFTSDQEALMWVNDYANRYKHYKWFKHIEYLLINTKTDKIYKGFKHNTNN
jgi:hypothetical protein